MRYFDFEKAESFEEAAQAKATGNPGEVAVMAGGTDLMGVWKDKLLKESPKTVVSMKDIPDSSYIKEEDGTIRIGAMTTLAKIADSELLKEKAPILSEAAHSVATPGIRNVGTIGGNICQDVRCWFYRYPSQIGDTFDCMRKGGAQCYAIQGENRYHSIFGGMKVHSTPCTSECPAGTDIPKYMEYLRKGDWDSAAKTIMKANPMPMLTSRICPHPCQDKCNQCLHGDSVNIHGVERSLGDYILAHADEYYKAPDHETGKKISIVGAGPSGLAAAYYLRKEGNAVTVYDRMEKAGGVLEYGIPHYRLPKDLVAKFVDCLAGMGIVFKMGVEIGKDVTVEELMNESDKVYFGTGAWKQPILGIDGENLTQFGLDFLVDVNKYLEKAIGNDVLVCGGGNVAMDVALTAIRLGAKNVSLVCLEQRNEMPATNEEIARAEEEGLKIYNGWGLKKVLTDESGKVTGLESMKCLSVRDENGRFSPKYDNEDTRVFESDYIILATGQRVDTSFLGDKLSAQLKSPRGLIDADLETLKTKNPKIYAGGDVVTGPNIAIRAIRAGRVAAMSMMSDFGETAAAAASEKDSLIFFDKDAVKVHEMHKLPERPLGERTLKDEDSSSFDLETSLSEAGRCMNCGCYSVNASDISPVLVALNAELVTTKKTIPAKDFFTTKLKAYDMLDRDELIKEIRFRIPEGYVSSYKKFRLRKSVDFAIVSLAYMLKVKDGVIEDSKVVLGGVAPVPKTRENVEQILNGQKPSEELALKAADAAVEGAVAMECNAYKIQEVHTLVKRMVEDLG